MAVSRRGPIDTGGALPLKVQSVWRYFVGTILLARVLASIALCETLAGQIGAQSVTWNIPKA